MTKKEISKSVLKRLPGYLAYLKNMPEGAPAHISATALANALGMGEVQVRKDLASISQAGRQKVGRPRAQLIADIEQHLDLATKTGAVVAGVGNLGQALLEYDGFSEFGLNLLAGFDIPPGVKYSKTEKPIYSMNRLRSFCRTHAVSIGIITVPAESAQDVCDHLVECGVKAIWNFAPCTLKVPPGILVKQENLALSLAHLNNQLRNAN